MAPQTPLGWWGLGLTVIALSSWVALPAITVAFRSTYPVVDTGLMPAIGVALTDIAAVFNVLCVWPWRERSMLNIAATLLTVAAGLFFTMMLVGEALQGA